MHHIVCLTIYLHLSFRHHILSDSEISSSNSDPIAAFSGQSLQFKLDRGDENESDDDENINWCIPQGNQINIFFFFWSQQCF